MFTGIIESKGKVIFLEKNGSNLKIGIESSFAKELKIGQSIAHNGVCLTVDTPLSRFGSGSQGEVECYYVTAVKESLLKTNLGSLKKGSIVNLERSLKVGDRLDGHFVQGHIDNTAKVKSIAKEKGSWLFEFGVSRQSSVISHLIIQKGSICINGVSLTVVAVSNRKPATKNQEPVFSVAIIPHTFKHTNFSTLKTGDDVNIEFDILGKYIEKILSSGRK